MLCKYIITYVVMAEAWISFIYVANLLYKYMYVCRRFSDREDVRIYVRPDILVLVLQHYRSSSKQVCMYVHTYIWLPCKQIHSLPCSEKG